MPRRQTFPSDEARREHYLKLLAEKLKDPRVRKIEVSLSARTKTSGAIGSTVLHGLPESLLSRTSSGITAKPYDSAVKYSKEPFRLMLVKVRTTRFTTPQLSHQRFRTRQSCGYILHYTQPGDCL